MPLLDRVDQTAEKIGAINTVVKEEEDWVGYNTDGLGLVSDLLQHCHQPLLKQRILILGAGGAVRGVLPALLAQQPELIHIHNRTQATAEQLATDCGGCVQAQSEADLLAGYDLIINGTSASLSGQMLALPSRVIGADTRCYDMMYGAVDTPYMAWARQQGATQVWDGLGMLVEQAAVAFTIWRGVTPDTAPIRAQLRAQLTA